MDNPIICTDCCRVPDEINEHWENEHEESIKETGECLECRVDADICESCSEYYFDSGDLESIKECGLCKECADEKFGKPDWMEENEEDFMDSYDPDPPE